MISSFDRDYFAEIYLSSIAQANPFFEKNGDIGESRLLAVAGETNFAPPQTKRE